MAVKASYGCRSMIAWQSDDFITANIFIIFMFSFMWRFILYVTSVNAVTSKTSGSMPYLKLNMRVICSKLSYENISHKIDLPWNVCVATSTSRSRSFVHRLYSTSRYTYREMFAWPHPPPDLSVSCTDCTPPVDGLTVKCLRGHIHLQISQFRAQIVLHQ